MNSAGPAEVPLLIFVVTEDWYFVSHRLPLARAARAAGYRVVVASRFSRHEALLRGEGFDTVPLRLRRRARSPLHDLFAILELRRLYGARRPAIVHHVALKPVVFGTLAALGLRAVAVVNAVAGLGYVFSSTKLHARLRRPLLGALLRRLFRRRRSLVIVQNDADRAALLNQGVVPEDRLRVIRGAGVDLDQFRAEVEPPGVPVILLAGRLIWDKGVGEFVAASRALHAADIPARFVLVGLPDEDSPLAVPTTALQEWVREGVTEWWGRRDDMPSVLAQAHIVCLPSTYGEGVPKILLEAAAAGRAVVTTDWPGCRDAVLPGETGLLVPPGDAAALTAALRRLIEDPVERRRLGAGGRALAERAFDVRQVIAETLACYREVWSS